MSQILNRQWRVSVGEATDSVATDELRVVFAVKRSLSREPNTATCKVYNLNKTERGLATQRQALLRIEAGYAGEFAEIFRGDIRTVSHRYEGVDWITSIDAGDGERAIRAARVAKSYKGRTSVKEILVDTAKSFVKNVGNLIDVVKTGDFSNGFAAFGKSADVLDKVARTAGVEWSVQSGALQFRVPGQPVGANAYLLSSETGLIGEPEVVPGDGKKKREIVRLKARLNPMISPGRLVRVDSVSLSGDFVAVVVEHRGDSRGAEWVTEIEGEHYR